MFDKGFTAADVHRFLSEHGVGVGNSIERQAEAFDAAEVALDFERPRW